MFRDVDAHGSGSADLRCRRPAACISVPPKNLVITAAVWPHGAEAAVYYMDSRTKFSGRVPLAIPTFRSETGTVLLVQSPISQTVIDEATSRPHLAWAGFHFALLPDIREAARCDDQYLGQFRGPIRSIAICPCESNCGRMPAAASSISYQFHCNNSWIPRSALRRALIGRRFTFVSSELTPLNLLPHLHRVAAPAACSKSPSAKARRRPPRHVLPETRARRRRRSVRLQGIEDC